jgi:hypothetical protein
MSSGAKPTARGFAIFFKIRPMLGRTSMAAGKRIRADVDWDRRGEPSRWQSETGRFACKPLTLVISAGRSSWPTSGEWQTTSTAMRRGTLARRAEARRCCKASQSAAAAVAACVCATRDRMATTPSIVAGSIATNAPARCVRKYGRCRSTRLSSAFSSMLSRRTRLRSRSPRWDNWRKRVDNLSGNGRSDESAPATRPSGRDASTTLSSLKTDSWHARSSEPGKTSCAPWKLLNRNMRAGARKNLLSLARQNVRHCRGSARTYRRFGAPIRR